MNKIKYCILFIIFAISSTEYSDIASLLSEYKRDFTLLEITSSQKIFSEDFSRRFSKSVNVVLFQNGDYDQLVKHVHFSKLNNLILLKPKQLDHEALNILSRCEHFDVVIIHHLKDILRLAWQNTFEETIKLADHIFIAIDPQQTPTATSFLEARDIDYQIIEGGKFIYCHAPKKGLDIARWNQKTFGRAPEYKYKIESDFNSKFLIKGNKKTAWIPGINLITFIMLYGIYPADKTIIKNIKAMSSVKHNDLVLGNMIVQGKKVVPIDFNDPRRNLKLRKAIKQAKKIFKRKKRLKRPEQVLNDYARKLTK